LPEESQRVQSALVAAPGAGTPLLTPAGLINHPDPCNRRYRLTAFGL